MALSVALATVFGSGTVFSEATTGSLSTVLGMPADTPVRLLRSTATLLQTDASDDLFDEFGDGMPNTRLWQSTSISTMLTKDEIARLGGGTAIFQNHLLGHLRMMRFHPEIDGGTWLSRSSSFERDGEGIEVSMETRQFSTFALV